MNIKGVRIVASLATVAGIGAQLASSWAGNRMLGERVSDVMKHDEGVKNTIRDMITNELNKR